MYQDTATVTVSAEQSAGEVEAVDNENVAIGLEAVTDNLKKVHFTGQLAAPDAPTHVCITLKNGLSYYGPIVNGHAEPNGGWLAFECDMIDPQLLV
ncbi:hypothetical protein CYD26_00865 [Pseudomonas sp. FFUP_PS_473]|jgi:hypothetical protein|uniref:hypothetical protein n=1 Tax=Pseudomonas TaxID=286 RepID=UPI0008113ABF|nr:MULTISPECIES: hypothetical protein [Pseudomonas]MEE3635815.1 hypothetical protein [Pseudomonas sp. AL 58]PLP96089.1 hypothetical protein CYD26_00865 [Pseudomonas sp. FFUP_PS_473]